MKTKGRKTIRVKVARDHIADGLMGSPKSCPIALALADLGFYEVSVGNDMASWRPCYYSIDWARLSQRAKDFVERFDEGNKVKPSTFVLRLFK